METTKKLTPSGDSSGDLSGDSREEDTNELIDIESKPKKATMRISGGETTEILSVKEAKVTGQDDEQVSLVKPPDDSEDAQVPDDLDQTLEYEACQDS